MGFLVLLLSGRLLADQIRDASRYFLLVKRPGDRDIWYYRSPNREWYNTY